MIRAVPRWTITAALVLLAGLCLGTLFTPQLLTQVRDEVLWREHSAAPTVASLNAYLRGCSACFYRRQVTAALAEAGKSAGLLAWLDTVYLYGRSTTEVDRWQVRGQTTAGAFSPDGGRVVTTGNGIGSVWDASSGKREYVVSPFPLSSSYRMSQEDRDNRLQLAVFFSDGRRLASMSAPGNVILWTADTGGKLQTITTGIREGASLAASRRLLAFVHDSKAATVLDTTTGTLTEHPHDGVAWVALLREDSMVTASADRAIWWFPGRDRPVRSVPLMLDGHLDGMSQDGEYLLVRAGRAVEVWSTRDGTRLSVLSEAADSDITATCSPGKNSFVVTGAGDGFLHLWSVETGRRVAKYPAHASHVDRIACHGGTKRVLSVGNHLDEAKVWSMEAFGKETTPVLRGQAVSGQLWAARLGADSHLVDLVPDFLQSTGEEWRPLVFLALAATAAALLFWLQSGRSKTRRAGRRK